MKKSAIVSGNSGQDGFYMSEILLDKDYDVYGIIRNNCHRDMSDLQPLSNKGLKILDGDITDPIFVSGVIKDIKPTEMYNFAAMSYVWYSFKNPALTFQTNTLPVVYMIDAIEKHSPETKFYQASSTEMWSGDPETAPQNEDTPFNPQSPYGISKLASHQLVRRARERGIFATSSILANHESERRGVDFVTRKITTSIAKIKYGLQDKIKLGNLTTKRDWGYSPEYMTAIHLIMQADEPDEYVIATGETHSIKEFLETSWTYAYGNIDKLYDHIETDPTMFRPNEVKVLCGNPSKAKEKLGWEPKVKFNELVKIMMKHDLKLVAESFHKNTSQCTPTRKDDGFFFGVG